ncbi:2-keto-4-pentenoate hydratase [Parasphingorhabdus cellanae]|uniref:2-keto-4-pentenoate hydratase n=1 Tax=Parasphingorhabdus cellanae TaxID=2806553 RepID=A0ABX7TAR3_9SPHN|nr:hypothetical protein [Parasphingorhabdus cellanae]QTD57630.1 hypothetical protein J4G78_09000 [Parasphingorhabdus cellanae]
MAIPDGVREASLSISDILVRARREAKTLEGFPGDLPETLEDAYAVQNQSRRAWHDEVGGWKVGGVPAAYLDRFDSKRLVGPIFRQNIVRAEVDERQSMPVYDGFAAVEGELVFCLGSVSAEDRLHIGVEIASSPLPAINDIGPIAVICDFGNNGGLIVGPEIEDWRTLQISELDVVTEIDGVVCGKSNISDFPTDALEALSFLRAHAARHDIALPAGTFISTGAITGVHEARAGSTSQVSFGRFGSLQIELIPAKPII